MSPRRVAAVLRRLHQLVEQGSVEFTFKAYFELKQLGLQDDDAIDLLAHLTTHDFAERLRSEPDDEWMYVFKPVTGIGVLYVKLVFRPHCVVVSFHEESENDEKLETS